MKNRIHSLITLAIFALSLLCLSLSASAQIGSWGTMRFTVLDPGTTTITTTAGVTVTNNPVDIHGYEGPVTIYMACTTNSSTSTGTSNLISYWVEQSSDLVSWSQLSSCAVSVSTSSIIPNGSLSATNVYLLPGTLTVPTAASAGFASTYLVPSAFTSTSSVFTNSTSGGAALIGFVAGDAKRYIRTASRVPSGTNNASFAAILIGERQY